MMEPGTRSAPVGFLDEGRRLLTSGRAEAALQILERAIELHAREARAHSGRGLALAALGRSEEALAAYALAAQLDPQDADTFLQVGHLMLRLGRLYNAYAAFCGALSLRPRDTEALEGCAVALSAMNRHEEAAARFDELLSLLPNDAQVAGRAFHARLNCCDWSDYDPIRESLSARVARGEPAGDPFSFLAHNERPADQRRRAELEIALRCSVKVSLAPPHRSEHERLRVAYLSADFRAHPVGRLLAPVLEQHDRSRFEIFALAAGMEDGSEIRRRVRAGCEHFLDITALQDAAVARRMAELEIDVAIDLGGHTQGSRLRVLAFRPAPIHMQYLGFPGTTGAGFIDYVIADEHVIPEAQRGHYSEQVIYLPGSYLPLPSALPNLPHVERASAHLPLDAFVFCSFNAQYKYTPRMFAAWMSILRAVPRGVLWLREVPARARLNLAREAQSHSVDPARLIFASHAASGAQYHARLGLADLFLDTYPYGAHSTATDALAAGVPVITLAGETFCSRVATSLLHGVGLSELAVARLSHYEQLAVDLAGNPDRLTNLKARLRGASARSAFDPARLCRHLERAYLDAWELRRRGRPPAMIKGSRFG